MSEQAWGRTLAQFVKFNLIGLLNTAIDFMAFALLTWLGVHYLLAQLSAYGAGMLNSLLLNSRFTFDAREDRGAAKTFMPDKTTGIRFVLWNGIVLGLTLLLLAVLKEWLGLNGLPAKLIVTAVSVALNFYGSKRWVYAGGSSQDGRSRKGEER